MTAANPGIPQPRELCGKTQGNGVCRLNKGHERLSPCQFERPEIQTAEYMPHGPAQRKIHSIDFSRTSKVLSPDIAGRIAYEAFQKRQVAELSAEVKQNATTKKPVPTGSRIAWDMLNKSTQETWIAVARSVLEAHGYL